MLPHARLRIGDNFLRVSFASLGSCYRDAYPRHVHVGMTDQIHLRFARVSHHCILTTARSFWRLIADPRKRSNYVADFRAFDPLSQPESPHSAKTYEYL